MEKFYLDLATILQNFHQNGELYAEIPAKKLNNRSPWKAFLRVSEGIVITCQIFNAQGIVVNEGESALEALYKLGALNWEVVPDLLEGSGKLPALNTRKVSKPLPPLPSQPDPLPDTSPVPYRLMSITLKQMNQTQWPRDYRVVYILVDGTRSIEKIASMLAMPLADVERIIHELQGMRIVDLNP